MAIKKEKSSHSCKAILFLCMDWRLHPQAENYFKKKYGSFDLVCSAGSIKGPLLNHLKLSQKLHHSKMIILTMHGDCGAYGGISNFKNKKDEFLHHKEILDKAWQILSKKFPEYKIKKYFLDLKLKQGVWKLIPKKI